MTLILSTLIIAGTYFLIYKAIRYIFTDLLDIYFSKKHQYEQPQKSSAETEFYKTATDIEDHLNKEKYNQEPRQVFHHLTQAEFEKWKAERDKQEP